MLAIEDRKIGADLSGDRKRNARTPVIPVAVSRAFFASPGALLINARRAQQSLYAIKGGIKGARGRDKEGRNGEKVRGRRKNERRQSG